MITMISLSKSARYPAIIFNTPISTLVGPLVVSTNKRKAVVNDPRPVWVSLPQLELPVRRLIRRFEHGSILAPGPLVLTCIVVKSLDDEVWLIGEVLVECADREIIDREALESFDKQFARLGKLCSMVGAKGTTSAESGLARLKAYNLINTIIGEKSATT